MPAILLECQDPRQRTITLDADRFAFHIARNHPEIEVEHIQRTVRRPDIITQDAKYQDRQNYYSLGAIEKWPIMFVKVCVQFGGAQGTVVAAFATDRPKASEVALWTRKGQ